MHRRTLVRADQGRDGVPALLLPGPTGRPQRMESGVRGVQLAEASGPGGQLGTPQPSTERTAARREAVILGIWRRPLTSRWHLEGNAADAACSSIAQRR